MLPRPTPPRASSTPLPLTTKSTGCLCTWPPAGQLRTVYITQETGSLLSVCTFCILYALSRVYSLSSVLNLVCSVLRVPCSLWPIEGVLATFSMFQSGCIIKH